MPWILELVILLVVVVFVWVMPGCQKKPATKRTLDEATKLSGDPNRKNYKPGHLPEFAVGCLNILVAIIIITRPF